MKALRIQDFSQKFTAITGDVKEGLIAARDGSYAVSFGRRTPKP